MLGGDFLQFKDPKCNIRNILVTISYDGKLYHGWQIQKNAVSVQEVFQKALYKIIGQAVDLKGCSRTDSGVHANMYCISFKTIHTISCERLICALNRYLPKNIAVFDCREVDDKFHARYSCKAKEYVYKIWNDKIRNPFLDGYALHYWYNIDVDLLNRASRDYVGQHDFTSFCTIDKRKMENMVRNVYKFEVIKQDKMIIMTVLADGFLYNMVRIMVGTLLKVAQGKIQEDEIKSIISAKDRSKAGPTASPCGLYLNRVFYEGI